MPTTARETAARTAVAERITVALIAKAAEDLKRTQERTGFSKTDLINRAISLYAFLDERLADGSEILLRDKDTGTTELIRLL
jgi:hypothetical protein